MFSFLKEFFYLQQSDRKVILTLLAVAAVALGGVFFTGNDNAALTTNGADSIDTATSDGREAAYDSRHSSGRQVSYAVDGRKTQLFAFDPNSADSTQLLALGLQPWQVRNIYKYRAAGGVYRRPEDFGRLYGLTAGEYRRLKPYIRISADYQPAAKLPEVEAADRQHPFGIEKDTALYPKKIAAGEQVVLNTADSATLRSVPGIGIHFAREIISHGRMLGGYVSVDQLDEIDFFPKEAKKYFVVRNAQPEKLNVNRLTFSQLRRHPYMGYHQAKAIVEYRRLHGRINSLSQLQLSPAFTPEVISRLEPYVEY